MLQKQLCFASQKQLCFETIYDDVRADAHISTLPSNIHEEAYTEVILDQLSYYRDLIDSMLFLHVDDANI
jgi:hypothetical protein